MPRQIFGFHLPVLSFIVTESLHSIHIHRDSRCVNRTEMVKKVHLLDYVAGNIRSLVNAIEKCGYEVEWIKSPEGVKNAEVRVVFF